MSKSMSQDKLEAFWISELTDKIFEKFDIHLIDCCNMDYDKYKNPIQAMKKDMDELIGKHLEGYNLEKGH